MKYLFHISFKVKLISSIYLIHSAIKHYLCIEYLFNSQEK